MGKMKVFLLAVIILAVSAAAIFFLGKDALGFSKENDDNSAKKLAELSFDTDVITTNLASDNFAIVQFNILGDSKEVKEELELRIAEVRAAVISTLASFKKEELIGTEGIEKLENEMTTKLKGIVEEGKIKRVLVTEFKVQ